MAEKIDFENMNGVDLLGYISFKNEFPDEAKMAFIIFCYRYQQDLLKKSEIFCSKFGHNEVKALLAVECTFEKVWKNAGTFDMKKAKTKNVDNAILLWMYPILYTQIILFRNRDTCAQPSEEEDLSIIYDIDGMIQYRIGEDLENKKELRAALEKINSAFLGLSEKHKIIYLTYKTYEEKGKNLPRSVSKKLKEQLDLTQNSIRVYKMEAYQHVFNYLEKINGNK